MRNKLNMILLTLLITAVGFIVYQNFLRSEEESGIHTHAIGDETQLYTCGMHPNIISDEPGNCPICGMKLIPVKKSAGPTSTERKILFWRAPMDPNEIYDKPGKSKMGMDLVPVYDDQSGTTGIVIIDPAVEQNMNVKTEIVKKRGLNLKVLTNGILTTDERREFIITIKTEGWIEKLYINYTGQKVRKGDKLMEIYSPELVSAQQEFLTALTYQSSLHSSSSVDLLNSGDELVRNAYKKLRLLEMPEVEIENLRQSKEVKTLSILYSPHSGTVIEKNVIEGEKISAGSPLIQIADLSNLWLIADIYEYELSKIQIGSLSEIKYNFLPGKTFSGKVTFIYPTLDPKSRTVKIRIDVPNPKDELKPSMFASVEIRGKDRGVTPVIPESALLRSGTRDIVILSLGEGRFKPQQVKVGDYAEGYYQILAGIEEGNKIVTSAQFLIDSESNLKSAISQFTNSADASSPIPKDVPMKSMVDEKTKSAPVKKEKSISVKEPQKSGNELKHEHAAEESSIIRDGEIDLQAIDKNRDGKLYECPMDWYVIGDSAGRCPICEMKLKEYTIEQTKMNLKKYGYKYKE